MAAWESGRNGIRAVARAWAIWSALTVAASAEQPIAGDQPLPPDTVRLSIVGGLASVTQFSELEQPFWEHEITERSGGRIVATIRPFDAGGLRGQEMLQLMRLGVVPFGTAILSVVSADEPELDAPDLPLLNPNMEALRETIAHYRDHMRRLLLERYGIVLLGIYVYPAQVIYCKEAFSSLDDLAGRKVRTSAVGQSNLMSALGAVPVIVPFSDIVDALRRDVADCAITGTLSGYEIGLPDVTSYLDGMAINWGLSFFGANRTAWEALPPDLQEVIASGVVDLETRIWAQAGADTDRGIACNIGAAEACDPSPDRPMTLVNAAADEARSRRLLKEIVLPRWIERCGQGCVEAWNANLASSTGITVGTD